MKQIIPVSDFKAKCPKIIDDVSLKKECVVITKRNKPVAMLVPIDQDIEIFGRMKGTELFLKKSIKQIIEKESILVSAISV